MAKLKGNIGSLVQRAAKEDKRNQLIPEITKAQKSKHRRDPDSQISGFTMKNTFVFGSCYPSL